MKPWIWLSVLGIGCAGYAALQAINIGQVRLASSNGGRLDVDTVADDWSTAIDLWPTAGKKPSVNSLAEITFHATRGTPDLEQFNISVMSDGQYRFGVEREGKGRFNDIVFCFENYEPGSAACVLKITPDGVWVNNWKHVDDRNWKKVVIE